MAEPALRECRVLVVEDEYLLADELTTALEEAGAVVIGPIGDLADAIALIQRGERIDAAILDVNLGGEMIFPAADLLIESGVPIVLTTGYDKSALPSRFSGVPLCEKPFAGRRLVQAVDQALHS
ncbi:response regulator [Sphingomonas sp. DT-51]|uniref:response regulator n=1 Tax=Sphingomonas sp. DT-51 TaxID=3396165 RepID=UPI003F1E18E7